MVEMRKKIAGIAINRSLVTRQGRMAHRTHPFYLLLACLRLLGWRARVLRIPSPGQLMLWGTIGLLCLFWIPRVLAALLGR